MIIRSKLFILWAAILTSVCVTHVTRADVWVTNYNSYNYLIQSLTTGPVVLGTGTAADPYRGCYDDIINVIPEGAVIRLGRGTHYTRGAVIPTAYAKLKKNQKLIGAGMSSPLTTVAIPFSTDTTFTNLYSPLYQNSSTVIYGIVGNDPNGIIEVSDVQVSAGTVSSTVYPHKRMGVTIEGAANIRRVKAINTYGRIGIATSGGGENFAIKTFLGMRHSIIEQCEVSQVNGDYCSAIGAHSNAIVRANRVIMPKRTSSNPRSFAAYNCEVANGLTVVDNYAEGADVGYYNDTGGQVDLVVANNLFTNVVYGVQMISYEHLQNITITGNRISCIRSVPFPDPSNQHVIGIAVDVYMIATNYVGTGNHIDIMGNLVDVANTGETPNADLYALHLSHNNLCDGTTCSSLTKIRVFGNTFARHTPLFPIRITNYNIPDSEIEWGINWASPCGAVIGKPQQVPYGQAGFPYYVCP